MADAFAQLRNGQKTAGRQPTLYTAEISHAGRFSRSTCDLPATIDLGNSFVCELST
jgi:hypothetical protein